MPRFWRSLAASLVAAFVAPAAHGAVVRSRSVEVEIGPDGTVSERVQLVVLLETAADFERWSPYPVFLDENRKLVSLKAEAVTPDGEPRWVGHKRRDRVGVAAEGVLHSSRQAEIVEFPRLPAGSTISLRYEVAGRPYFPSGTLPLAGDEAVEQLHLEVRGGGAGWRWRLDGPSDGLTLADGPGSVTVDGALAALVELPQAPERRRPVLRYAWGARDWSAVAGWYRDLLRGVPEGDEAVRAAARQATAGAGGKREAVERLLALVRSDLRYVAVEVGIGGYRPDAPAAVLARRWGDCKDKALLLVDLLAEVGIEAYPVLVRSSTEGGIDDAFPAPDEFNHAIVAVRAEGLADAAEGPVAGGWLFLDATQPGGGLRWLHAGVAGQQALVVLAAGGELVEIPVRPDTEGERIEAELTVDADGAAGGRLRLELRGEKGLALAEAVAAERPEAVLAAAFSALGERLPGASFADVEVRGERGVAAAAVTATVRVPRLVAGGRDEPWLVLPGVPASPSPGLLDDRREPVVLRPGVWEAVWSIALPWTDCALADAAAAVDGPVGSFLQEASLAGSTLTVRRRTELRRRQVEPAGFTELAAVALAEHRTAKRRLRLGCSGG